MSEIDRLREEVERKLECRTTHREFVEVEEFAKGCLLWGGFVHVFDLEGHPDRDRCYAWRDKNDAAVVVPAHPPIESPQGAVRWHLVQELKAREIAKIHRPD